MRPEIRQILSVSRRTDIPAFYMPWFMDCVNRGVVDVVNPYNGKVRHVALAPERIHTMVFWSKNFGPFLTEGCGEKLRRLGYHLAFNFTINSHVPILEPGVPDLDQRLDQLRDLCRRFGADAVQWRFDPICHFAEPGGGVADNLADFDRIASVAGECGVATCITSFMDHYRKIERRTRGRLVFSEPDLKAKTAILLNMERTVQPWGIELDLCCEQAVLDQLPPQSTIAAAACISGARAMALHGGRVSLRRDGGQRRMSGCGCTVSVDVGDYNRHPCYHNCLFCYANPACDRRLHP